MKKTSNFTGNIAGIWPISQPAVPLTEVRMHSSPPPNSWHGHKDAVTHLTIGATQGSSNKECADTCRMTSVLGVPKILLWYAHAELNRPTD